MKKFKLAFLDSHLLVKLLLAAFWIFCTHAPFLSGRENFDRSSEITQLYTINIVMFSYDFMVFAFTNLKLYKTLPLKSSDITVTVTIGSHISALVFFAAISLLLAAFGNWFVIPYYGAAMIFTDTFTAAILPPMLRTAKYGADAMREAEEKPKSKRHTANVVALAILIILAEAIPGTALCLRGWDSEGQIMRDIPLLLAVYIGCITVSAVLLTIYKKKIKYYIY